MVKRERLERERLTIRLMIEIFCRGRHHPVESLCTECQGLLTYAMQRIERCPFQGDKPTCAKCSVHCYRSNMREDVRQVMRYAGPRMLVYHPILTIQHYLDELSQAKKTKADARVKD